MYSQSLCTHSANVDQVDTLSSSQKRRGTATSVVASIWLNQTLACYLAVLFDRLHANDAILLLRCTHVFKHCVLCYV